MTLLSGIEDGSLLEQLAAALKNPGYLVLDNALPAVLAASLRAECIAQENAGFRPAGTGREQGHQVNAETRSDGICWLDAATLASKVYLDCMEELRKSLNSRLFLGLFDYECHYARYAPGAFYRTHLDAFTGGKNRVLSTVLYLNEDWQESEGGELFLYAPDAQTVLERIVPLHNRLVLFLSERFPHEVKPALRTRYSLAGWFRVKGEQSWLRPV